MAGRDTFLTDDPGMGRHFGRADEDLDLGIVGQRGIGLGQVAVLGVQQSRRPQPTARPENLPALQRFPGDVGQIDGHATAGIDDLALHLVCLQATNAPGQSTRLNFDLVPHSQAPID